MTDEQKEGVLVVATGEKGDEGSMMQTLQQLLYSARPGRPALGFETFNFLSSFEG